MNFKIISFFFLFGFFSNINVTLFGCFCCCNTDDVVEFEVAPQARSNNDSQKSIKTDPVLCFENLGRNPLRTEFKILLGHSKTIFSQLCMRNLSLELYCTQLKSNILKIRCHKQKEIISICCLYLNEYLKYTSEKTADYSGWLQERHKIKKSDLYIVVLYAAYLLNEWVNVTISRDEYGDSINHEVYMKRICTAINTIISVSFVTMPYIYPIDL